MKFLHSTSIYGIYILILLRNPTFQDLFSYGNGCCRGTWVQPNFHSRQLKKNKGKARVYKNEKL